ncbi:hypothetical protein ACFOWU_06450 [Epilithonimonas zeae]|uniref:Ligand-binding SRPBCC domain-containing protein n=1 Tax=Epilithonimonas zeae TaxID=1416779 RepID=A0A1N6FMD4_9FLAO|nr:SRPBCC family protein [Epilithonimonas zeae]SIN96412.1 Ligand-binding SRPBCC domain-containing protein [Epilithonimonas zeae]
MKHQLKREQQLNCNIEKAWAFFSSANNLSVITPKDMNFTVLTQLENDDIFEGMIIDYHVSPLFNIKMNWQTEIIKVDYLKSFIDFQVKGPYKLWHHYHEFVENDEGVLVKDVVDYELPLGFLGEIAHNLFVKKKLDHIFDYRKEVLELLFNQKRKAS